jgi:hypothetical protein
MYQSPRVLVCVLIYVPFRLSRENTPRKRTLPVLMSSTLPLEAQWTLPAAE